MSKKRRPGDRYVIVFPGGRSYHREMPAGVAACNVGGRLGTGGERTTVRTARKVRLLPCGRCFG